MKYLVVLALLLQLAIPLKMILSQEIIRRDGVEIRLRCAPVDPADPFRGRYVAIAYDNKSVKGIQPKNEEHLINDVYRGNLCWAQFDKGENGEYKLIRLAKEPSSVGIWIKTRNARVWRHEKETLPISIELDQDRFYMNEKAAPAAEAAYNRRKWKDVYATLRVHNGNVVLVDLDCDGKPIAEAVKALAAE